MDIGAKRSALSTVIVWMTAFAFGCFSLVPQGLMTAATADGLAIILCTADGPVRILLGADGQPVEPDTADASCELSTSAKTFVQAEAPKGATTALKWRGDVPARIRTFLLSQDPDERFEPRAPPILL